MKLPELKQESEERVVEGIREMRVAVKEGGNIEPIAKRMINEVCDNEKLGRYVKSLLNKVFLLAKTEVNFESKRRKELEKYFDEVEELLKEEFKKRGVITCERDEDLSDEQWESINLTNFTRSLLWSGMGTFAHDIIEGGFGEEYLLKNRHKPRAHANLETAIKATKIEGVRESINNALRKKSSKAKK